jgi:hypothetical protein
MTLKNLFLVLCFPSGSEELSERHCTKSEALQPSRTPLSTAVVPRNLFVTQIGSLRLSESF